MVLALHTAKVYNITTKSSAGC